MIIDIGCPGDCRIKVKEEEKMINYDDLKWKIFGFLVIPIVIGALGVISTHPPTWLKKIGANV